MEALCHFGAPVGVDRTSSRRASVVEDRHVEQAEALGVGKLIASVKDADGNIIGLIQLP
jgi:predicted peroxiredoxin